MQGKALQRCLHHPSPFRRLRFLKGVDCQNIPKFTSFFHNIWPWKKFPHRGKSQNRIQKR